MATGEASKRRLIVNADDFGRSASINASVIQAHREGILTTASLMVNEPSCGEAVRLAKANPRLGVGLHLSLLCGKAGLSPDRIPGLADAQGRFTESPVAAGVRYFFLPALRSQLRAEIRQQLVVFRETGLPLDHVNGHLHMHLHPTIHNILLELAAEFQIRHVRLTRDPLRLNLALSRGHMFYRFSHALIFDKRQGYFVEVDHVELGEQAVTEHFSRDAGAVGNKICCSFLQHCSGRCKKWR